nr:xylanase [Lachnospiraceae bacterium]
TRLDEPALHPIGMRAATTQGALAVLRDGVDDKTKETAYRWIRDFFDTPLRQGDRRYYDNCLYMFAFLALSGNYRAW